VISWETILYGAALSALAAAAAVGLVRRERRVTVLIGAALAGAIGPLAWNAILHDVDASGFFVDAPFALVPASWQDTGSGVFALAAATLTLGFGPLRRATALASAVAAVACGFAAFLVDVYLY
jgi:hypothetical protein